MKPKVDHSSTPTPGYSKSSYGKAALNQDTNHYFHQFRILIDFGKQLAHCTTVTHAKVLDRSARYTTVTYLKEFLFNRYAMFHPKSGQQMRAIIMVLCCFNTKLN